MDLEIVGLFIDLILLGLAHVFFPPQRQSRQRKYWDEDSARWIILDSPQDCRNTNQMPPDNREEIDPFLNGEYDDGPNW